MILPASLSLFRIRSAALSLAAHLLTGLSPAFIAHWARQDTAPSNGIGKVTLLHLQLGRRLLVPSSIPLEPLFTPIIFLSAYVVVGCTVLFSL